MASFDKDLFGITTLIECGINSFKSQGSGFYYNELSPRDPNIEAGQWRKIIGTYLITNRHVALPRLNDKELLPNYFVFNLRENINNNIEWYQIRLNSDQLKERLILHPDQTVDVVAIKVDDLIIDTVRDNPDKKIIFGSCLTNENLPSNSQLEIEVSSDIIVASYPRGFYDNVNKFPIVKSGIISSAWGRNFNGKPMFLIDAQLFPGSSGGLVISKPTNIAMIDGKLMYNKVKQFVLLGVYSGEPIQRYDPVEIGDITVVRKSSYGLGNVWYSSLIHDIITIGIRL